ncbi:DUF1566 domain-containing protein [Desulfobotulus sp. H1]|uniref:DUF1566 domain-containing protein n=1 Tax=Desulfobotulus pelophilus TaxID=2823377 RepID=A0ABT3N7F7_9BACT|nr:DUF1566 domain-containing protein [Desulfobotulus pelophilus]MCW7753393.1 DUF1566 domain-containing protein [Desulfobotulus pelophilus]
MKKNPSRLCDWVFLIVCMVVLPSCSPKAVPMVVNSEGPYAVGNRGPAGGWIIHDKGHDSDGWRYLEAAAQDQTPLSWRHKGLVRWGCSGQPVPGARYAGLGWGGVNTQAIVDACSEPDIAARLCTEYRGGDRDDWYLPALDELNIIYIHLFQQGIGGLGLGEYWSSTETTRGYVWSHNFSNGKQLYSGKNPKYRVRCVRAFSGNKE